MQIFASKRFIGLLLLAVAPMVAAGPFVVPGLSLQPIPSGSGARALGQGNAFIGVADDATAASWNPGGLAQLEAPEVSFAVETLRLRSRQNWPDHSEAETVGKARLHALNYLSVVQPLRLAGRHAVVSLNYLKQYHFDRVLDYQVDLTASAPFAAFYGRAKQETASGALTVLAPALAIDVWQNFSVGMALNIWNDGVTGDSRITFSDDEWVTTIYNNPNRPAKVEHNVFREKFRVDQGYSLTLGALYRLSEAWSVGLTLKPPHALEIDYSSRYDKTTYTNGTVSTGAPELQSTDAKLQMPWMIGGGLAYRFSDALMVALDVQWTQWSQYVYTVGGQELNPLNGKSSHDYEANDTIAIRTGLEYVIIKEKTLIPLRCGLAYEQTPTLDGTDEYYTVTVGGGYQIGRYMFDAAYELRSGSDLVGRADSSVAGNTVHELRHRLLVSLILYF